MKSFCNNIVHSPVSYKLLIDITALWTLFSAAFFIADFILPGVLSLYISVGFIMGILIILLMCTISLAHIQKRTSDVSEDTKHPYLIIFLVLMTIPLLILATSNFPLTARLLLIVTPLFFLLLVYKADC